MNYIQQVNQFYKLLPNNPLSSNAQCLYFYLLNKNNELGWIKEFTVANSIICGFTSLSRQALDRARNELKSKGYINYKKGVSKKAGKYLIVSFETQNDTQDNTQNDIQSGHTITTLNKQNKTYNKNPLSDSIELKKHFDITWSIYPNKKGRAKAEGYFLQWIKGRKINGSIKKLTDKQMYLAVQKYREECQEKEIEQRFIKHGDTFFNTAILDYVEEECE